MGSIKLLGQDDCESCVDAKRELAEELQAKQVDYVDVYSDEGGRLIEAAERAGFNLVDTPSFVEVGDDGQVKNACDAVKKVDGQLRLACPIKGKAQKLPRLKPLKRLK